MRPVGTSKRRISDASGLDSVWVISPRAFSATPQELLGHKDIATTLVYTHVLNRGTLGVKSPADLLAAAPLPR